MKITDINGSVTLANGVKMPYLGLGVYKAKEGNELENAIQSALETGYRHFDTASMYKNEEGVGAAIKKSGIPREEVFLTTKVWNSDQGYEPTLKAFETSLKKLDSDYVDLYLIHWPVPVKYIEAWKAMEKLYKEGRIKAIGVCNCMPHHLESLEKEGEIRPMVLQNEFHPRLVQQELLDYCRDKNIQYEAWSPLMRGRIVDNNQLKEIAQKHEKSVAQVVIRWDLQKGVVTIPKSVHKERIRENAAVFDFELSAQEMQLIDSLDKEERTGAHPDTFMEQL
ncbi:aldo/keto reductase [Zunongwangia sp. F363]|uniref:Aldo/keto reductase n=1 Tax=Autumnicola tepida TaxID=3075595 RepID=A0ABU3CBK8_9FLAO|nr:aldo/keto reductase [Zunongwangia sp. F363]MDT0643732.1 aldo/keto reductase [Zunongwangia sp. F363]